MGFLKFLKRESKKDSLDELDLPPAPPPLEGAQTEFGASGSFDEKMPEFPELPDFDEKISAPEDMKFDFPEENMQELSGKLPDLGFPDMGENLMRDVQPAPAAPVKPAVPEPMPSIYAMQDTGIAEEEAAEPSDYSKPRLFAHERRIMERPNVKTIYVKVDNFKATLGSINLIRSDLRKSEEALLKLENIKNAKDKSFDRMRSSLDDLQKKLVFIDETLFKGE